MEKYNTKSIERYQELYEKDPASRVFAPLAEGYRLMGLMKEALEVCQKGVKLHPDFAGGRVALGRVLLDLKRYAEAETELRKVIELSPENILAYSLLAETELHLKKPKEALKAYKMLLFLAPENEKALKAVKKLESLTADDYDEDIFKMRPLQEAVDEWNSFGLDSESQPKAKLAAEPTFNNSDRFLSLADAYIVRNDIERGLNVLQEAERLLGSHPEIVKRLKLIHQRQLENIPYPKTAKDLAPPPARERVVLDEKIEFLQDLLAQFKNRTYARNQ